MTLVRGQSGAATALRRALGHEEKWEDWQGDDTSVEVHKNEVRFSVYSTDGHPDDLDRIVGIMDDKKASNIETYENAQELRVTFEFDSPEAELEEIKDTSFAQASISRAADNEFQSQS